LPAGRPVERRSPQRDGYVVPEILADAYAVRKNEGFIDDVDPGRRWRGNNCPDCASLFGLAQIARLHGEAAIGSRQHRQSRNRSAECSRPQPGHCRPPQIRAARPPAKPFDSSKDRDSRSASVQVLALFVGSAAE
jgi:hypothetical protein